MLPLSDLEFVRYSKQLLLPGWEEAGQLKLKNGSVLILGAGGLGCPVAQTLAAAGVGHIWLCDDDKVELTNLPRQTLFTTSQIGQFKAEAAKARLQDQNPWPLIHSITKRMDDAELTQLIDEVDLVIDCSDNLPTRHQLNRLCYQQHKPLFAAAVTGHMAQIYLIHSQNHNGCYQCLVPAQTALTRNCATEGVHSALTALTGNTLAYMVLNALLGDATGYGHYWLFQPQHFGFTKFSLLADPHCPICGHPPEHATRSF